MYSTAEKICIICGEFGLSSKKFYRLMQSFSPKELWENFGKSEIAEEIVGSDYRKLRAEMNDAAFEKLEKEMSKHGVVAVTAFSESFPQNLAEIDEPPYALFCRGDVGLLKTRCLAVVGTRKVSYYGKRVATDFTAMLADKFTIVSGLAYGVDTVAHETTLKEGGKTIAVFGGGILNVYPSANERLAEDIVNNGGLLASEYGLRADPKPFRFPHRNRIVSGLSVGLLVCQAPLKSGTFTTVTCALEQGRDVFVVPGEIYDSGFSGSNCLIKDMQGAAVTNPNDIIDFYGETVEKQEKRSVTLSFDEQKIVDALADGKLTFDNLIEKTSILPSDMNFLLANLELKSIIARLPGNFYRLVGGLE